MRILVTGSNLDEAIKDITTSEEAGFDTEAYGVGWMDRLFSVQIATAQHTYYFNTIRYGWVASQRDECPYFNYEELASILQEIFSVPSIVWYIHNAKYDMRRLAIENIYIAGKIHCTQMCARFIFNQHISYNLSSCLKRIGLEKDDAVGNYIKEHKLWEWEQKVGRKTRSKNKFFDKVPFDIMFEYGCIDAEGVLALGKGQREELKGELYYENDLELQKVAYRMEEVGITVRRGYAKQGYNYEKHEEDETVAKLSELSGNPYKSGRNWLKETFDRFDVAYRTNPKTGNPIFDKAALAEIEHPIADLIRKYRHHQQYAGTYYATYKEQEVIHAFIKLWGTDTGRFSYAEPNLQNVPKEAKLTDDIPYQVRGCFKPRPDFSFVMVDFDQQEFRLLLDYAGEVDVIRKINDHGEDVHDATASMVGISRDHAKTLNFALLYGMGNEKLAKALGVSVHEAKSFRGQYFARLPRVQRLIREIISTAEVRGHIKTWIGRRLYFPNKDMAYKAPNHLIQGGCGDIARHAMVGCARDVLVGRKSELLLQVHDELLFEVHKDELDIIDPLVSIMENTYTPFNGMRLTCGVDHSWKSWGKRDVKTGKPLLEVG